MGWVLFSIAVCSLVGVCAAYFISQRRLRNQAHQGLYGGRATLTPAEFYRVHFSASGIPEDLVSTLLTIFREEDNLDFSRIDPDKNYLEPFTKVDFLTFLDSILRIEEEFAIRLTLEDHARLQTFRQIVETVHHRSGI